MIWNGVIEMKQKFKIDETVWEYYDYLAGKVFIIEKPRIMIKRVLVYNVEQHAQDVLWGLFYTGEATPTATFKDKSMALLYRHKLLKNES